MEIIGDDSRNLAAVLAEFYGGSTTPARKFEIDRLLGQFKRQPDSWKHCQRYMMSGHLTGSIDGQYLLFFSVLVFEEFVRRKWVDAPVSDKNSIRSFLFQCLATNGAAWPQFISTKLAKVNVDIAKHDWPHDHPDFISWLVVALGGSDGGEQSMALLLLQIVAEEFVSTRQDVLAARQQQLTVLLTAQLPTLFATLFGLLDPPCSAHLCRLVLTTVSQFFSWVPLSELITPGRLGILCQCSIAQASNAIGPMALSCLSELLSKNYVPAEFSDFLLVCFEHILVLLEMVASGASIEGAVNEEYTDKVIEFTLTFFTNHLRRVEGQESGGFDMPRMLGQLFTVTFGRSGASATELVRGIECWDFFVEYVSNHLSDGNIVARYQEGLQMVSQATLGKVLWESNPHTLIELLEDEEAENQRLSQHEQLRLGFTADEAGPLSDMAHFKTKSIDLLTSVAELYPEAVLGHIFVKWEAAWSRCVTHFDGLGELTSIPQNTGQPTETIVSDAAWLTRDLTVLLQIWGALTEQLTHDFHGRFDFAIKVVSSLLTVGQHLRLHFLHWKRAGDAVATLYAQWWSTIKSFTPWLKQYSAVPENMTNKFSVLLGQLLVMMLPALQIECPVVACAAATVLGAVSSTVRPTGLCECPGMTDIVHRAHGLCQELAVKWPQWPAAELLCAAVSNALLIEGNTDLSAKPTSNDTQSRQCFERHRVWTAEIVKPFALLVSRQDFAIAAESHSSFVQYSLRSVAAIVREVDGENSAIKQAVLDSISCALPGVLQTLHVYVNSPKVLESVAALLCVVCATLRAHLARAGSVFVDDTIRCFLRLCEGDAVFEPHIEGSNRQDSVLPKFLTLLTGLVQDRGAVSRELLPALIDLALERLYPILIVSAKCSEELQLIFYGLLHAMLMCHWQHFVPSAINPLSTAVPYHTEAFLRLLQAVGSCFESETSSPSLFAYNLKRLEQLHDKRQLYGRQEFAEHLRLPFLRTLFTTLLRRSHALLQDEILVTIHSIAAVDFDHFHQQCLVPLLAEATGLTDVQKQALLDGFSKERDVPTFTACAQAFVADFCFYQNACTVSD